MSILPSIHMGWNALRFDSEDTSSSLTMKSEWLLVGLRIDLPKLTTITAATGSGICESFGYPRHLTLRGLCFVFVSSLDLPSLSTVVLQQAFQVLSEYSIVSLLFVSQFKRRRVCSFIFQ